VPPRIPERIRRAILDSAYDMTVHAVEEMAEDTLDLTDEETAILNGRLINREKDEPRGHGILFTGQEQMEPRLWGPWADSLRVAAISSLPCTR